MLVNHWYPACATSQLRDTALAAQIGDVNAVVFRDEKGQARALLDRCCHRGFPLSHSVLKDGHLHCGYHGWEYDADGRCTRIPFLPSDRRIPDRFRVPSFPCSEQDGYIWIWVGDGEPSQLPAIPETAEGRWVQGMRIIDCNFLRALEITYDLYHIYFVHPSHHAAVRGRDYGFAWTSYELRATRDGCVLFTPPAESELEPIPTRAATMEFRLPGTIRYRLWFGRSTAYMYFFVTPLTEKRCRMDWLMSNMHPPKGAERIEWIGDGGPESMWEEDHVALELIQPAYDREGDAFENSVEADLPTLTLRRVVKAAEAGKWDDDALHRIKRRLITVAIPGRGQAENSS